MSSKYKSWFFQLIIFIAFASSLIFTACGKTTERLQSSRNIVQTSIDNDAQGIAVSDVISQIKELSAPTGVNEELFNSLKNELEKALITRGVAKLASGPPTGEANYIPDLEAIDIDGQLNLRWSYYNVGDYNQDGVVNIQDVLPLARHFRHKRDENGSWTDGLDEVIDGNGDGMVDIRDVKSLADNFFNEVREYLVYGSLDGETWLPEPVGRIAFNGSGQPTERRRITTLRPEGEYYYVHVAPVDRDNNQGEASNISADIPMPKPREGYVGAERCLTCHPGISTWYDTAHRQSQRDPNEGAQVLPDAQWSGTITITDSGTGISFEVDLSKSGTDYFAKIGGRTYKVIRTYGGGFGYKQRYITRVKHSELILPFQWNELANNGAGGWGPYDVTNWFDANGPLPEPNMSANFAKDCMGCHSTGYTLEYSPYYGEWVGAFNDINTTCERCHGPGQAHVTAPSPNNIFNANDPADGSYQTRMMLCGSCHTRGESIDLIGGEPTEYPWSAIDGGYIPGMDLVSMFSSTSYSGSAFWQTSAGFSYVKKHRQQYLDFQQSAHYASGTVTCWTCHDVHEPEPQIDAIQSLTEEEAKTRCIGCHSDHNSQAHWKHSGNGPNTWCASCHMVPTGKSAVAWDNRSHVFWPIPPQESINKLDAGQPVILNSCNNIVNGQSCHGGASALNDRDALVAKQADYDAWFGGG